MKNNDIIIYSTSREDIDRSGFRKGKGCTGTTVAPSNSGGISASRVQQNARAKTAGLLLLLACFFLPGQAIAGVTPLNDRTSPGYLKVFSATQESQWGEGGYYYLHTGYRVYDSNGKVVKWVENHDSSIDEAPQKVELTPGTYTIWAQSDKDGYVKVPVTIKLDRITTVHLETGSGDNREVLHSTKVTKSLSRHIVDSKS